MIQIYNLNQVRIEMMNILTKEINFDNVKIIL